MEPLSALVAIIAAGASSALSETAAKAVKDAYEGVKALLAPRIASWVGLEHAPKDDEKRRQVSDELQASALTDNPEVIERIKQLDAALRSVPAAVLEKSGVSIEDLGAAQDVLIKDVKFGKYFEVRRITSRSGKIDISGLSGWSGAEPEKN